MIRLRTLGSIGLTDASGAELAPVLRQPKRFALLAYLALAKPRGFHRRDSILALFWPELDSERARGSLRQALYTLRRQLPADVLANRGDGEVGLLLAHLWCDVHAFEEELAAGRPEAALALYRGDLLPGFHVPDAAPDLEYWIEEERRRLHDLALTAVEDATAAAETRGDVGSAVRWAARGSALAPLDEEVARREMGVRYRAGDRAGALGAFEQWSRRAEDELGLTPTPATLELVERLRSSPERAAPAPGAVRPRTASGPPAAPMPRPRPASGSLWKVVAGAAAVLVLTAVTLLLPIRMDWSDGAAAAAGSRLMVLPFAYRGAGEAAYLSEGLVYLFSVALDGEELRTLDPHGLLRRAAEQGQREYDPAAAAALADRLDAAYFLLGNVVETDGGLQLSASLYERDGPTPIAAATATGTTADVLDLVDAISAQLLTARAGASSSRVTRLAAVTSHSLPALKSYLAGERMMRQGRFDSAISSFEQAVAADSLFALAHYRTSEAASWAFRGDLATRAALQAVRYANRLPERERLLLLGHEAYRQGDAAGAVEILHDLTLLYPDDPEVWHRLGEVRMHFGPLYGWSIKEARAPFMRALELDSTYTETHYHLAQLAVAERDTVAALDFIRLGLTAAPSGARAPQLRLLRAVLRHGQGWDERLAELGGAGDFTIVSSVYNVSLYAARPDLGREIARLLTAPSRPAQTRVFGHLLVAELELALGRAGAARASLAALEELDPGQADQFRALLTGAPAARPSADDLASTLARLTGDTPTPRSPPTEWKPDDRYGALPRLYSLGMLAGVLGRTTELGRAAHALAAESVTVGDHVMDLRLLGGEPGSGQPPRFAVPAEEAVLSPVLSRPWRRFMEARRLEAEGRPRDALIWYESLELFSVHDLPWGVPALLDRARLHEALGEAAAAATLYRRFADLWSDADDPSPRRAALDGLRRLQRRATGEQPGR